MQRENRPIVTLTSDFGLADAYVAAMKGAVLRECQEAVLVDVTHLVGRQDVLAGSIMLERAWAGFAGHERRAALVHLAVVDPGVGTERDLVMAEAGGKGAGGEGDGGGRESGGGGGVGGVGVGGGGAWIVCPDNGLLTWLERRHGCIGRVWRVREVPEEASAVFHGRDVLGPLAGRLAAGWRPEDAGERGEPTARGRSAGAGRGLEVEPKPGGPVLLEVDLAPTGGRLGLVIHVDGFGNATTNIPAERLADAGLGAGGQVNVGGRRLPLRRTYGDVDVGKPVALVGSSGLLEVAVRDGSAARDLGLVVGAAVEF